MGEVGVYRSSDDFTVNFPELVSSITESDDLSRTHEGEVQRVEEKHNILP